MYVYLYVIILAMIFMREIKQKIIPSVLIYLHVNIIIIVHIISKRYLIITYKRPLSCVCVCFLYNFTIEYIKQVLVKSKQVFLTSHNDFQMNLHLVTRSSDHTYVLYMTRVNFGRYKLCDRLYIITLQ